ncbi:hypothetical protein CMI46_01805 [Candidatus Pacearchaeota archaeon]|nr:hypothetical protein [Candidatus Pacearchaeota archaeon]|tara:strand:+ start:7793 stop:8101 length:309 start_codon:yes stop_codon:yes gene_type:complete
MNKAENILFWILILIVLGITLWLAFGSPIFETSLLTILIFVACSEIIIWRFLFASDKRAAISFENVRSDFNLVKNELRHINNRTGSMEKDLKEIKDSLIKRK